MWNALARDVPDYDYMYQCGDDIYFIESGWITESINKLKINNNVGVSGPTDKNNLALKLTQTMTHRSHHDKLGFYFPREIKNWYCDNWIIELYKPNGFMPLQNHTCMNLGGKPRYDIIHCPGLCSKLIKRDKIKLARKVISFSLYGSHPIYTYGMIENCMLSKHNYREWEINIYYNYTVPHKIIEALKKFDHVTLIEIKSHRGNKNMLWRFLPCFDNNYDIVIVRDADSRLNVREARAVEEWLYSDCDFHVMRDHIHHSVTILGGMFGCRNNIIKPYEHLFYDFDYINKVGDDQNFLQKM
jgi:hypothetical protein